MIELFEYSKPVDMLKTMSPQKRSENLTQGVLSNGSANLDVTLSRAKKNLTRLVYANHGQHKQRTKIITYTFPDYHELKQANQEWKNYVLRTNYQLGLDLQYVTVPEYHTSHGIHYHAVIFNYPFLQRVYERTRNMWGGGRIFLDTKNTQKGVQYVVNYVTKYITKDFFDPRFKGQKRYLRSRGLIMPRIVSNPEDIHLFKSFLYERPYSENSINNIYMKGTAKTFHIPEEDIPFMNSRIDTFNHQLTDIPETLF